MNIEKGAVTVRSELFGGRGEVRLWSLIGGGAEPFAAVLSCELSPGGSVGAHVQQEFPEIVIGVEGDGTASVNGVLSPLCPGDVVYLPLGSVLALENRSSDAALKYLIIKARG